MKRKTVFMESTDVPADRSFNEIVGVLRAAGATEIRTTYQEGVVAALRWSMAIEHSGVVAFDMPARVDPVFRILKSRITSKMDTAKTEKLRAKAERVAWRQLLRWIEAQMAMVQTGMVKPGEVFLAYAIEAGNGKTLYQNIIEGQKLRALPSPDRV